MLFQGIELPPEIKIILYSAFVVSLFIFSTLKTYAVIATVICVFLLRMPFTKLKSGWIPIGIFLAFTFVSNVLNQHGRIVWSIGPFIITAEGLEIAALRTLRILFMIAGAKILIASTSSDDLIGALGRLFRPLEKIGLPVRDFVHTMGLTLKCFPQLKKMVVQIYSEKKEREALNGFWNKVKVIALFLLPLFVRSVQSPEIFFEDSEIREE